MTTNDAPVPLLMLLTPDDAHERIERRTEAVAAELASIDGQLRQYRDVPRLFMLAEEFQRTVLTAELTWLRKVAEDLRAGRLTWNDRPVCDIAAPLVPREQGSLT